MKKFENTAAVLQFRLTHIRGGLIDHIYVNKVLMQKDPFTSQRSVTYSDHDKIVLHIPLENKSI